MVAPVTVAGRFTTVLLNQFDFTSQLDSANRDSTVEVQDVTTFGNQSHLRAPTNLDDKMDFSGFFDASTASAFNRVIQSLLGTYGVITCSYEGDVAGASCDLVSGLILNNAVDAKPTDIATTKLSLGVSNPVNQLGASLTPLGYDVPASNFGKILLPKTVVAVTTLVSSASLNLPPADLALTNQQVVVHAHLLAVTGAVTVTVQHSPNNAAWTTIGTIINASAVATSVRAAFSVTQSAAHWFRIQYQGVSQPYTLAAAVALGAAY